MSNAKKITKAKEVVNTEEKELESNIQIEVLDNKNTTEVVAQDTKENNTKSSK